MPGEAMHQRGAEGARRAKQWLDATTRVHKSWTNEDSVATSKLEYQWPHGGQPFSFDVGGILSGDPYENQFFLAEVKNYSGHSDQGVMYEDYLAKCYVTKRQSQIADQFMWITWHPFNVTTWRRLCEPEKVQESVIKNHKRIFDVETAEEAVPMVDANLVKDVAARLWLIVLSDKQEELVISPKARAYIVAAQISGELTL